MPCCFASVPLVFTAWLVSMSAPRDTLRVRCRQLGIEPGQKLQVITYEHRIEFLPIESPQSLRGFLPGLDTDVPREGDRV